jgi:LacI family transcriptional regulator
MTASRVLTGRGKVSEAAREKVLRAADDLGYVPNEVARSLRSKRSHVVSLIVTDIENSFYSSIAKNAERAFTAAGYRLLISSSDESGEQERDLLQGVSQVRADALLIAPTPHNGDLLAKLAAGGLPVVQLDRAITGLDCPRILLDNARATSDAVEHLYERGHRAVAVISGPQDLTTGSERAAGARDAAARHPDLRLDVIEAPSYMHEESVDTVLRALTLHPTAVVAGNNIVLEACLDAFARGGVRVPDDVALVGFDDLPWMRWVQPALTTVRQPVEEMTRIGVALLLAALGEAVHAAAAEPAVPGPVAAEYRLPAELIVRASTPARPAARPAG